MAMSIGLEPSFRRVGNPLWLMLVVFGVGAGFFSNSAFQLLPDEDQGVLLRQSSTPAASLRAHSSVRYKSRLAKA